MTPIVQPILTRRVHQQAEMYLREAHVNAPSKCRAE
jgi:hypothetical protein